MSTDATAATEAAAATGAAAPADRPSLVRSSLLVAEREVVTQVRSKAFRVSFLITLLLIIAGFVVFAVIGGGPAEPVRVAVVEGTDVPAAALTPNPVTGGLEATQAADRAQAERLLRDGEVDAIISADPASPTGTRVTGLDEPPYEVAQSLTTLPTLDTLEAGGGDEGPLRFVVALVYGLLFMTLCLGSGAMIVQNTVTEKQSRIVEILLSAIPSRALLAGKILGNSAIAVGQALAYAAVGALAMLVLGHAEILGVVGASLAWFLVFFVPGFLLVAAMFAASASLVSRQEDSGTVMTPTMMLVMLPYFVVVFFQDNPLILTIASYVPFTATVAMPVRLFLGDAAWWEPLVSVAILVACTLLVIALAARIYRGSLLHVGRPMKVRAALAAGRR